MTRLFLAVLVLALVFLLWGSAFAESIYFKDDQSMCFTYLTLDDHKNFVLYNESAGGEEFKVDPAGHVIIRGHIVATDRKIYQDFLQVFFNIQKVMDRNASRGIK